MNNNLKVHVNSLHDYMYMQLQLVNKTGHKYS